MTSERVPLCRLWKRESGKGATYFVGRMGGARVLVFENLRKATDEDHDAEIFVVAAPQAEDGRG